MVGILAKDFRLLSKFPSSLWTGVVVAITLGGCDNFDRVRQGNRVALQTVSMQDVRQTGQVIAQGKIQPAHGPLRMSALPGDRLEKLLVAPGQKVRRGEAIAILQSLELRTIELEIAELKLLEANNALSTKKEESQLAIDAAELKFASARKMLEQAEAQRRFALKGNEQLDPLKRQIDALEGLRMNPLTRAAIGTIDLEMKKNEMLKLSASTEQAIFAADQAVELGKLQVSQAERALDAARQASSLIDKASPIASLTKQIELLKLQIEQCKMESPIDGVVLSINAEPGERLAQLPIAEIVSLDQMVCMAEVHEADVAKVALGDQAELKSPSLPRKLKGKVHRIDRVVGAVQMRFPNPMARSDFRAIPVWIAIDQEDTLAASERLQLQVEVTIRRADDKNTH